MFSHARNLLIVALLAGCSTINTTDIALPSSSVPPVLGFVDSTTTTTARSTTMPSTTSPATTEAPNADLASETTATLPKSNTPTTLRTAGPATEGTQAPQDLMSQYRGVLGNYSLHQVLATAPAPAPTPTPGTHVLTGLPGSVVGPAVVVKVDNSNKAAPQSGLNSADIIIEEEVEWGITRLAAIFQSQHAVVGPIRSGRTTDLSFLGSLGNPALVYSGANRIIDTLLLRQDYIQNFSAARSGAYWRDSTRRAPSNLFANTASFANSGSAPQPWFAYRDAATEAKGAQVTTLSMTLGSTNVSWAWTGSEWLRTQNGKAHLTDGGAQVTAANIVVPSVQVVDSGMVDSAGGFVPEVVWAGTGGVVVFTEGRRIDGTWTRATLADPAILIDANGEVIELTPGRTWVELATHGVTSN